MKQGFIIFFLFLLPIVAFGQVNKLGFPFYRYYGMEEYGGTEQNWAIVKDNRGLIYVGNNDKGVLQYDGKNWRQIPVSNNSIVRSLAADMDGIVYVGAVGEFGRLLPDKRGYLKYNSLVSSIDSSKRKDFSDVWKIYVSDSLVYFCTYRNVFKYYKNQDSIKLITLPENSFFSFFIDNELYTSHFRNGIMQFQDDTIYQYAGQDILSRKNVFVLEELNDSTNIVGTFSNGLYTMKKSDFSVSKAECKSTSGYLGKNLLYFADVDPEYSAFATLSGGVLVTNKMKPFEIYGDKSGLPKDETVTYLYSDNSINTPLWAGLNNGLIRIDWHLPFRLMDERNGISGHVNDIIRYNDQLYIGTSSGLYMLKYGETYPYFEEVSSFSEGVFKLLKYKYPNSDTEVLLIGTIQGLFELNKNGQIFQIEKKIRISDAKVFKEDKRFYIFNLGALNENDPREIALGTRKGLWLFGAYESYWKEKKYVELNLEVRTITHDELGYWMGTSFNGVVRYDVNLDSVFRYGIEDGLPAMDQNFVEKINGIVHVLTSDGIYIFDKKTGKFNKEELYNRIAEVSKMGVSKFVRDKDYYYLNMYSKEYQRIRRVNIDGNYREYDTAIFNRLPNVQFDAIYPDPEGDVIWLGSSKGLFSFNKTMEKNISGKKFTTLIRTVSIKNDSIIYGGAYNQNGKIVSAQPETEDVRLHFGDNDIEFKFSAPYYEKEEDLLYSYMLEGYDENWSKWSPKTEEDYNNLPAGDYTFKVRAKNIYGFISENDAFGSSVGVGNAFKFRILPPWYATVYAIIGYFILLVLLVRFIVQWRTRKLKLEKERLERIVEERTAEIREKKNEIEQQRDEIAEKNQSITDSIHYASRIQQALLPSTKMFEDNVPEHFVLFKPRDIVSGDYYWMTRIEQKVILVAADCTGHGVPGAFMSMLGMSFLNEIVNKNVTTDAGEILNQLRAHVIDALKQEGDDVKAKDGMDLALYVIDRENNTINFAGANNPLYIIRELTDEEKQAIKDGDEKKLPKRPVYDETHILQEIKADKMPIGIHIKNQPFETKTIPIQKGMQLYTFSDGYVDQFGGPKRRKFMSKSFKQLLMQIYQKPMQEQRQILDESIIKWIEEGNEIQVDDIIVLGVRIVK